MAAYTWVMVVVLIFVVAISYAYVTPALNKVTGQVNKQIDSGDLSEQTVYTYNWNLTFFIWIPAICLIGLAIYAITRAIEVSEAGKGGYG